MYNHQARIREHYLREGLSERMRDVRMYVGGEYRGQMMMIVSDDSFERILGWTWEFPGEYDFVFYAHRKWNSGEFGVDGPDSKHRFPAPKVGEYWDCDLILLQDNRTWIAIPKEFVAPDGRWKSE